MAVAKAAQISIIVAFDHPGINLPPTSVFKIIMVKNMTNSIMIDIIAANKYGAYFLFIYISKHNAELSVVETARSEASQAVEDHATWGQVLFIALATFLVIYLLQNSESL